VSLPRKGALVLAGLLFLLAMGCGDRRVGVEGKVTLDGKPLSKAMVVFRPEAGGQESGDVTDDDGSFRVKGAQADGLVPGQYKVTVSKKEYPPGMTPPGPKEMSFKLSAKMIEVLHKNYTMQDKTPLRVLVPPGGSKDVQIPLNKDGT
jgi:hypothetical protein